MKTMQVFEAEDMPTRLKGDFYEFVEHCYCGNPNAIIWDITRKTERWDRRLSNWLRKDGATEND